MSKRVLIFYISRYSGHYHAAEAIEKGLNICDKTIDVAKINALEYTSPLVGKIVNKAYIELIKKKPELWGNIYDNPEVMEKTQKAREAFHRFNMTKIKALLNEHSPEVVYCTQAFPCGMVADYKRSCETNIKLIGVLTDHAPHSYWLHDEVDYYIVPSHDTKDALIKKGVDTGKIKVLGIPVDPRFAEKKSKQQMRDKLSLKRDLPVLLLMGGNQGLGSIGEVSKSLLSDKEHNYQLVVVTGKNKRLAGKLNRLAKGKGGENIHIFSYVDNIDEFMEAADLIITKAGGMTTAEAMAKRLPLLIIDPIPGQERYNTDHFVSQGAAIEVSDFNEIHRVINDLFDSTDRMERLKKSIKELAKPNSARDIALLAFEE